MMTVETQRMITSQRPELPSEINIYSATWAQIIFGTLARRYPKMEAQQTIEWLDTIMFRGPKAVRVTT